MGNLLFCHHKDHDGAVKSWRKGRKEEVEARPLPLTGKQPQQIGAADHLGFLGAISLQRMSQPHHSHHHNPFGQYFHRYRRTGKEHGEEEKKKKSKSKVSSKSASKVTAPSIDNNNNNKNNSKFVSCSGLAYNSVASSKSTTTVFPSSFSNLNNKPDHPNHQQQQQPKQQLLPNRSLSLQPPVTLSSCPMISRQEFSIRHRKYPPLPSVPGGRTPTLKVPTLKKMMMSSSPASSSSSFHRSVSLGGRGGPAAAAAANVHSGKSLATNRGHQSFKSSSSSSTPMNKTMTPGKPSLVARKR